jgi:hypothetical protein
VRVVCSGRGCGCYPAEGQVMRAKPHSPIANEQHSPRARRNTLPAPELSAFIARAGEILGMVMVEGELDAAQWLTGRDF